MTKALNNIKALTFDTGGTVLDWHTGFRNAFAIAGEKHGIQRNWAALANKLRSQSLELMWHLPQDKVRDYTFDDAHREALLALLTEEELTSFDEHDIKSISYEAVHSFSAWPEVANAIQRLRTKYLCVPLTVLSYKIVIDTARTNQINWDAIFACQGIGYMKPNANVYRSGAHYLQLDPSECLMVACHNFDLNAASEVGFQTAFISRPDEWGGAPPPELISNSKHSIFAKDFNDLADQLNCD